MPSDTLPADHPCRTSHDPEYVGPLNYERADLYRCRLCHADLRRPWQRACAPMRAYDPYDAEDYYRADDEAEQREGRWK